MKIPRWIFDPEERAVYGVLRKCEDEFYMTAYITRFSADPYMVTRVSYEGTLPVEHKDYIEITEEEAELIVKGWDEAVETFNREVRRISRELDDKQRRTERDYAQT